MNVNKDINEYISATDFRLAMKIHLDNAKQGTIYIKRGNDMYRVTYIPSKVVYTDAPDDVAEALDNARPLTPAEQVEVDAALDALKTGKTNLEFAPGAVIDGPSFLNAPNYTDVKAKLEAVAKAEREKRDPFGINEPKYEPMEK